MDLREELMDAVFGLRRWREIVPVSRRGLRAVAETRAALDVLEAELVVQARRDGATWEQIGDDLGCPRTTVRSRYLRLCPPRRGLAGPRRGN